MISSAMQLKAKIKNISDGNSDKSKTFIRIFFMERFLERLSVSQYKDNFVLKGGMLTASLIGVNLRSTMDIDATIIALPLNEKDIEEIIYNICNIKIDDGVTFEISSISQIIDDFDYHGVRVHINGFLEKIRQPFKIDISTNDAITPRAIEYKYDLMFEDRSIKLFSYNIETMLAEKFYSVISFGLANTRMRDYYDIYEINAIKKHSKEIFKKAFIATCKRRDNIFSDERIKNEINGISHSNIVIERWTSFAKANYYVSNVDWKNVVASLEQLAEEICGENHG